MIVKKKKEKMGKGKVEILIYVLLLFFLNFKIREQIFFMILNVLLKYILIDIQIFKMLLYGYIINYYLFKIRIFVREVKRKSEDERDLKYWLF